MRICFVLNDFNEGGAERSVKDLLVQLRTYEGVDPLLIVDSHPSFSHLISRVACAGLSVPHVSTYHNVYDERAYVKRVAERTRRRFSDRLIRV
jgi:hypothetical protein